MKKLILIVLTSIVLLWFTQTYAKAQKDDCKLAFHKPIEIETNYSHLYSNDNISQAMMNLKKYCCQTTSDPVYKEDCDKLNLDDTSYAESKFLLDHIIDIGLRSLDGFSNQCYNIQVDEKAIKRREETTKWIWDGQENGLPIQLQNLHKQYRWNEVSFTSFKDAVSCKNLLPSWDDEYSNLWLTSKYQMVCPMSVCLYQKWINSEYKIDLTEVKKWYEWCQKIVANRLADETLYVKSLIGHRSANLLKDTINAYVGKYFTERRMMNLQKTIFEITDLFDTITKNAAATKQCTK